MRGARLAGSLVLAATLIGGGARAEPSPEEAAIARQQFRAGIEAVDRGRWEEAREAFQRSYDVWPRQITLLNLSGAQSQTGRLVDAANGYRRFLREAAGAAEAQKPAAEEALADVERRLPRVRLVASGTPLATDTLTLDGTAIASALVGVPLPVDPGTHEARVVRGVADVASASFEIHESEALDVPIAIPAPPPPPVVALRPPPELPRAKGVLETPWFWAITGVVVGGAAATLVFATR